MPRPVSRILCVAFVTLGIVFSADSALASDYARIVNRAGFTVTYNLNRYEYRIGRDDSEVHRFRNGESVENSFFTRGQRKSYRLVTGRNTPTSYFRERNGELYLSDR